jgi:hypothetical protein
LEERQRGIRPSRCNIDNIFITGQFFEKCYEHNTDLHNIFIEYTQALDYEYGNKIIKYLVQYKVPATLITLIDLTLINEYTVDFKVESRVNKEIHYQGLYLV